MPYNHLRLSFLEDLFCNVSIRLLLADNMVCDESLAMSTLAPMHTCDAFGDADFGKGVDCRLDDLSPAGSR